MLYHSITASYHLLNVFTVYPLWISTDTNLLDLLRSITSTWFDLRDVECFGGTTHDFTDFYHMNDANSRRLLE